MPEIRGVVFNFWDFSPKAVHFLPQISGVVIIIVGALIESIYRNYLNFLAPKLSFASPPMVLIGVGLVIFVVGFFGCCGAAKENRCMVVTVSAWSSR